MVFIEAKPLLSISLTVRYWESIRDQTLEISKWIMNNSRPMTFTSTLSWLGFHRKSDCPSRPTCSLLRVRVFLPTLVVASVPHTAARRIWRLDNTFRQPVHVCARARGVKCEIFSGCPVRAGQGLTETFTSPVVQQHWKPPPPSPE